MAANNVAAAILLEPGDPPRAWGVVVKSSAPRLRADARGGDGGVREELARGQF
jgi:hypothetical protein